MCETLSMGGKLSARILLCCSPRGVRPGLNLSSSSGRLGKFPKHYNSLDAELVL